LIDQAINIKQKQIELLKERRQILIHKAVTRGLNPNVKMKDSGVEWIGEIPEGWEVKRLKHLANIVYGISPHEKTYNDNGEGSILVNGPAEYSESEFGYTRAIKWTTAPSKFAKKGSLLFCLRGSTTGRLNICHEDIAVGRGCAAILAKENHEFLIRAVSSLKDKIIETFKGSTFPSVTSSDLDNYSIPKPPINEQLEIAEHINILVNKIATAISLKEQEIERLKEYKATLINSAVTGKVKVV
jgi:type I restriction enzyme S subunit